MEATKMDPNKMKTVFTIVDRAGKSYWQRIGVGFVNSDGSVSLKLDAIPINGSMQMRDYEPNGDGRGGGRRPSSSDAMV